MIENKLFGSSQIPPENMLFIEEKDTNDSAMIIKILLNVESRFGNMELQLLRYKDETKL